MKIIFWLNIILFESLNIALVTLTETQTPATHENLVLDRIYQPEELKRCFGNKDIRALDLSNYDIGTLESDTFNLCQNLQKITLSSNNLTTLPSDIFAQNFLLENIKLDDNQLTTVNPSWFVSCRTILSYLDLSNNFITVLGLERFPKMLALKYLHISQNHLINIDETLVMKKLPKVKKIAFQYNQIGCRRHKDLIKYFNDSNINTSTAGHHKQSKGFHFEQVVKGTGCINDTDWTYLMLTKKYGQAYMEQSNANDHLNLIWISLGMSALGLILIFGFFMFKLWRVFRPKPHRYPNFTTELGEYYDSSIQRTHPTGSFPTYASVDKNREAHKQEEDVVDSC